MYIYIYTYIERERMHENMNCELRGIGLVRTIISQLILTVAIFKGIFFEKNYVSCLFHYHTMSDITTELL